MRHPAAFAVLGFLAVAAAASACARAPQPPPESPARIKDSPPEKIAGQRAAQSNLNLEDEDERWGVEAARERKQQTGRNDPAVQAPVPPPRGPTDLGSPASAPPAPR